MLRKNPGFTVILILVLAIGIGVNTIVFSLINAWRNLSTLPFENPERLVSMAEQNRPWDDRDGLLSPRNIAEWQQRCFSFESMACGQTQFLPWQNAGAPDSSVCVWRWTGEIFDVMEISLPLGRPFISNSGSIEEDNVVLLSNGLWKMHFAADPNVLGQSMVIDNQSYRIIGVLPNVGPYGYQQAVWVPMPRQARASDPGWYKTRIIARLKGHVTLEQARSEVDAVTKDMIRGYPGEYKSWAVTVKSMQHTADLVTGAAYIFQIPVGLLLMITCSNAAGMILARGLSRRKELSIRIALGAGRGRLIKQLLIESTLYALLAGAAGLCILLAGISLIKRFGSPLLTHYLGIWVVDNRVTFFTVAVSLFAGLVCGLFPALILSKRNLNEALKSGTTSFMEHRSHSRFLHGLVIGEIAMSVILLVSTGLMIRSSRQIGRIDLGFNPENLLTADISLSGPQLESNSTKGRIYRQVVDQIKNLYGVQSVAVSQSLPYIPGIGVEIRPANRPSSEGQDSQEQFQARWINPEYFQALEIPVSRGRVFNEVDEYETANTVIINESLARHLWPQGDALGKYLDIEGDGKNHYEVIGIVGNTKQLDLVLEEKPTLYLPFGRRPAGMMSVAIRASSDPVQLSQAVRETLKRINPDLLVDKFGSMQSKIENSQVLSWPGHIAGYLGVLSLGALILAATGIYGIIAYTTSQRTHEIGIRMALGAQTKDVLVSILRRGIKLVLIGVTLGLLIAVGVGRLMGKLLYEVSPTDPVTLIGVSVLLGFAALLACYIPARRAAKTDPLKALRYE